MEAPASPTGSNGNHHQRPLNNANPRCGISLAVPYLHRPKSPNPHPEATVPPFSTRFSSPVAANPPWTIHTPKK